jgi:hypothetical protein
MQLRCTAIAILGLLSAAQHRPLGARHGVPAGVPAEVAAGMPGGTFLLTALNQRRLPIDEGSVPHRFGGESECRLVLDEGRLSLDPGRRRYDLHYLRRSSCDGAILSQSGELGAYAQRGSELAFERPSVDGPSEFRGAVRGDSVVVQLFDDRMVFVRAGIPDAAPVRAARGRLSLRRAAGRPLPVPYGGNAGPGCPLMLDSAALHLTPDPSARTVFASATGVFSLRYQLRSACSGRVLHHTEERGAYEEIAHAVYFEARVGPSALHRFRGVKRGREAIDVYFGGVAWRFGE